LVWILYKIIVEIKVILFRLVKTSSFSPSKLAKPYWDGILMKHISFTINCYGSAKPSNGLTRQSFHKASCKVNPSVTRLQFLSQWHYSQYLRPPVKLTPQNH
jgi:hypothetical protein